VKYGSAWKADFTAEVDGPDLIVLHGRYNDHPADVMMRREGLQFPLSSHKTNWVVRGVHGSYF
jgi:hypothetical protein